MFANCPWTDFDFPECVCYSELFADTGNRNHRNAGWGLPFFLKGWAEQPSTRHLAWGPVKEKWSVKSKYGKLRDRDNHHKRVCSLLTSAILPATCHNWIFSIEHSAEYMFALLPSSWLIFCSCLNPWAAAILLLPLLFLSSSWDILPTLKVSFGCKNPETMFTAPFQTFHE